MFAPHAPAVPAASVCTPGCRFMVPVTARNSENVGPLPVGTSEGFDMTLGAHGVVEAPSSLRYQELCGVEIPRFSAPT